jgi:hypothetical protein
MQHTVEPKIDITFIIEPFTEMNVKDSIFDVIQRLVDSIQHNTLLNYEVLFAANENNWNEESSDKIKELLVVKSESKADYQYIPFEIFTNTLFDSELYNTLCKKAKGEYICIVSPCDYLPQNFSLHLLNKYVSVKHSGIVGISDLSIEYNNTFFAPLTDSTNENFELVLQPKDYSINQTCFFSKDVFHTIGAFDEKINLGSLCVKQYCLRANYMGFHNYYLSEITKTTIFNESYKLSFHSELGMSDMISSRNFYIPVLY